MIDDLPTELNKSINEVPFVFYTLSAIMAGLGLGISVYGIIWSLTYELYEITFVFILIGAVVSVGFLYIYSKVAPEILEWKRNYQPDE